MLETDVFKLDFSRPEVLMGAMILCTREFIMKFSRITPRSFACTMAVALSALAFGFSTAFPQAPQTVRVRGSVVSLDGSTLTVKTRQGPEVTIKLADNFRIASVVKASLSDIKPGVFIGTATVTKDGGSHALEVLVFPEALRGTGEGDYAWDLTPDSMMTNGTVGTSVESVAGPTITVAYKGGERRITVTPDTPIVTLGPADKSDIKPGTPVFSTTQKQADGTYTAASVTVGKNGVAPPM